MVFVQWEIHKKKSKNFSNTIAKTERMCYTVIVYMRGGNKNSSAKRYAFGYRKQCAVESRTNGKNIFGF